MQIKLSDRLQAIAEHVEKDEVVADIGTDHGHIPIWLMANKKCRGVILSDVNKGPLKKAAENIEKYMPGVSFDLRLGNGISVLEPGEADTVIIAGMGGLLIKQILSEEPDKVRLMKKLILQPRNNSAELRNWLKKSEYFTIVDEQVVKEVDKYSEIITVLGNEFVAEDDAERIAAAERIEKLLELESSIYEEFPVMYLAAIGKVSEDGFSSGSVGGGIGKERTDNSAIFKTVLEFIDHKMKVERKIIKSIDENGQSEDASSRLDQAKTRLKSFETIREVLIGGFKKYY